MKTIGKTSGLKHYQISLKKSLKIDFLNVLNANTLDIDAAIRNDFADLLYIGLVMNLEDFLIDEIEE